MKYCRILLTPLKKTNAENEYSEKGLVSVTGNKHFNPELNFSRPDFFTHLVIPQKGMSISGFQPKLQMIIQDDHFDIINEKGDFILKPSPESFPYLAENEHATMLIMKHLKFDVPPLGLFYFQQEENAEREYAFAIKRYDRDENGVLHQEQLDGAMGISEKYGKIGQDNEQYVSYEKVVKFILAHTQNTIAIKKDLFRRIAYAYLLGNNDMHLRNFSLIHLRSGKYQLAPIYDFVSVAPYKEVFHSGELALPLLAREEGNKDIANGFETKYGTYIGVDFLEFGKNIGLSEKLTTKLISQLAEEKNIVEDIYTRSFLPQSHIEAVLNCYHQRLNYLQVLYEDKL